MGSSLLSTLLLLLVGSLLARLTANRLKGLALPAIVLELVVGFLLGNSFLPYSRIAPLAGLTELGVLTLFLWWGLRCKAAYWVQDLQRCCAPCCFLRSRPCWLGGHCNRDLGFQMPAQFCAWPFLVPRALA